MNIESINSASTNPRASSQGGAAQAVRPSVAPDVAEVPKSQQAVQQSPSNADVEDAVKRLADFVSTSQSEISFSIDDVSGVRVVKILDTQSKEVIRQIPSEEAVELARALDKLQGLLIKAKA